MNYHSNGREYRRKPYRTMTLLMAIILFLVAVVVAQCSGLKAMADDAEQARVKHIKELNVKSDSVTIMTQKYNWLKDYCEDR